MVPRLIRSLFCAPEVNPTTGKALTVPVLNPINKYGRVFFFSWFSFCMAFLSWYAFPPLVCTIFLLFVLVPPMLSD